MDGGCVPSGKVRNLQNITFGWEPLQPIVQVFYFKKLKSTRVAWHVGSK
jgi:hypothetical protein